MLKIISDFLPAPLFVKKKHVKRRKFSFKMFIKKCYLSKNIFRILGKLKYISQIYELLEDEYSKSILIRVLSGRIFGFGNIVVSPYTNILLKNNKFFFKKIIVPNQGLDVEKYKLKLFNLRPIGYPINLYNDNQTIFSIFYLQQYRYNHKNVIGAEEGDFVLDAGSCWGDTALYFATKVGSIGKVFSFEFLERNLIIFNENLNLNQNLKHIIEITKHPIWKESNRTINYYEDGVCGVVSLNRKKLLSQKLSTISIDDFIKEKNLTKIDFIKMDIEGAEIAALLGAKETLMKFKPKLAISIYHKFEHYYKIPYFINSLNLNYKFYLDHFSLGPAETILFGVVPENKNIFG